MYCAGALIAPQVVLTAAHCAVPADVLGPVYFGLDDVHPLQSPVAQRVSDGEPHEDDALKKSEPLSTFFALRGDERQSESPPWSDVERLCGTSSLGDKVLAQRASIKPTPVMLKDEEAYMTCFRASLKNI